MLHLGRKGKSKPGKEGLRLHAPCKSWTPWQKHPEPWNSHVFSCGLYPAFVCPKAWYRNATRVVAWFFLGKAVRAGVTSVGTKFGLIAKSIAHCSVITQNEICSWFLKNNLNSQIINLFWSEGLCQRTGYMAKELPNSSNMLQHSNMLYTPRDWMQNLGPFFFCL